MASAVMDAASVVSPAEPAMLELKTHNHLLGNKAALDRAWHDDGYWFFRDVLDRDAVARIRRVFTDELEQQGVIDPVGDADTARSVRYNGASLADFTWRMEPLARRQPWRSFVAEPGVHDFFVRLFDAEPFWVPVVEYRATPPAQDPARARCDGIHQDGPYSPGIPFRICWIPLAEIDADIGGVTLAAGLTEQINRHPLEEGSNKAIPLDALPADAWRRTTYRAGDVLMMNLWTPHSGLSNLSDRFRLSLDHRVMAVSDKCPLVGSVVAISADRVTVRTGDGEVSLRIVPETYVRNDDGKKLAGDAIAAFHRPGQEVIIAYDGDTASVVRPPH